jgi:F-type H+-transporting ATPase subunit b
MELVTPSIGLVFWTSIVFVLLIILLAKFAWKPILATIKERENTIEQALNAAENAKKEMQKLQADNEKFMREARAERDILLKEARDAKDAMIAEAKGKANSEADKIIRQAKETINTEKLAAITELKNSVGSLAIEIAEKIIKEQLSSDDKQKSLVSNLLQEANLN